MIEELYSGEIIACNSHFHFDHIASNYEFQPIHVYEDDYVRQVAENGLPKEALGAQLDEEMFQFGYPKTWMQSTFTSSLMRRCLWRTAMSLTLAAAK